MDIVWRAILIAIVAVSILGLAGIIFDQLDRAIPAGTAKKIANYLRLLRRR